MLDVVKKCSPSKSRCDGCNAWVLSTSRFCQNCSQENRDFNDEAYELHRGGKRGSWKTNEKVEDVELDEATQKAVTDLMKELRSRAKKAKLDPQDTSAAPASAEQASSSKPAKDVAPAQEETSSDSDPEYDLDTTEGCVAFICAHWPKNKRSELKPIATFFVQTKLRPLAHKTRPLSLVYRSEVKDTLKTKKGRESWAAAWATNRKNRFVRKPEVK